MSCEFRFIYVPDSEGQASHYTDSRVGDRSHELGKLCTGNEAAGREESSLSFLCSE